MTEAERLREISRNVDRALQHHIKSHSALIWQVYPSGKQEIGSATCINIGGSLFLATAAHNFDVTQQGGVGRIFSASRSSDSPLKIVASNYGSANVPDVPDVAWLEVDRNSASESDLAGVPLGLTQPYHVLDPHGLYDVTGFPAELKHIKEANNHRIITINGIVYATNPSSSPPPTVDDLFLDYGESAITEGGPSKMPHPGGISGGGIWYAPLVDDHSGLRVWSPAGFTLVGIVTHYRDLTRRIRGLQMHHWFKLLRADRSDLHSCLDPILDRL
jgi:hypothetical protein